MDQMRITVGAKEDDDGAIRQFVNGFEFLFGDSPDDDDDDDECEEITKSRSAGTSRRVSSTISGVTANRGINSTFSYTESDPTIFKPKLHFMSTRDVLKILRDNSKDFLASRVRARCRVLQNPEMWVRIVDAAKENDENITMADYESIIYQMLEFRILYEYLNGGIGGDPFLNIRKMYPTDEEKWAKKEQQLSNMEAGEVDTTTERTPYLSAASSLVVPQKKTTKKKRILEKIASNPLPQQTNSCDTSSDSDRSSDDDPDQLLVEHHRRQKRLSSVDITADNKQVPQTSKTLVTSSPTVLTQTYSTADEEHLEDEWVHVGGSAARSRKTSFSKPVVAAPVEKRQPLATLSEKANKITFRNVWHKKDPMSMYICPSYSVRAATARTFIHVTPLSKELGSRVSLECPF